MTPSEPKSFYQRFLQGHESKLHFSAHSHHFWPDVSRKGHMAYWDDCALASDEKWGKIFSEVIPDAQKYIASLLNLKNSLQIAFAPNTHELATRILSLFAGKNDLKVLTTSSEFHSWKRQLLRLSELPEVQITTVSTEHLLTERKKFIDELKDELQKGPDLFYISQVFFDSGIALASLDLENLASVKPDHTLMVVDGYHAFAALPVDLSKLEGKIFYLAGGYKYAQAGEGAAFLVIPKGKWRPAYTGWFAEYDELSKPKGALVGYSDDWMAFMGATQDVSGLYRFNAVWEFFADQGLTINRIHEYVRDLQQVFLKGPGMNFIHSQKLKPLFEEDLIWHGHFLTFEAASVALAESFEKKLKENHIYIDRRGARLRFGFGLYQNKSDVEKLGQLLSSLK